MKKGSKSERDPEKLASQLDRLRELNPRDSVSSGELYSAPIHRRNSVRHCWFRGLHIGCRRKHSAVSSIRLLRLLDRIADGAAARRRVSATPAKICVSTGTVLIREWHGTKHQVTVLKDGFPYRAKLFHSLSQIARTITGSRWSGPLFFGLKSSRKEQSSEAA